MVARRRPHLREGGVGREGERRGGVGGGEGRGRGMREKGEERRVREKEGGS